MKLEYNITLRDYWRYSVSTFFRDMRIFFLLSAILLLIGGLLSFTDNELESDFFIGSTVFFIFLILGIGLFMKLVVLFLTVFNNRSLGEHEVTLEGSLIRITGGGREIREIELSSIEKVRILKNLCIIYYDDKTTFMPTEIFNKIK